MLDNKKIRQLNIHLLVSITSTVRHLENDLFVPRMSAAFYYSIFVSIRYGRALVSSELGGLVAVNVAIQVHENYFKEWLRTSRKEVDFSNSLIVHKENTKEINA